MGMIGQDLVFFESEGDEWFKRNKDYLEKKSDFDFPLEMLRRLNQKEQIQTVLEIGCSNGWRLQQIKSILPNAQLFGVEPSAAAIESGQKNAPDINFVRGLVSDLPLQQDFDLVIVNFVLHWVDRKSLFQSLSEIDRVVADEGYLIVGDFYPDYPQKRSYHHLADEGVFTFKQDYAQLFAGVGTYKEMAKFCYDHEKKSSELNFDGSAEQGSRAVCSLLRKSLTKYYKTV